jgi:hypothetical protein
MPKKNGIRTQPEAASAAGRTLNKSKDKDAKTSAASALSNRPAKTYRKK